MPSVSLPLDINPQESLCTSPHVLSDFIPTPADIFIRLMESLYKLHGSSSPSTIAVETRDKGDTTVGAMLFYSLSDLKMYLLLKGFNFD